MTLPELQALIILNACKHQPAEEWEAETIEWNTIYAIFEYAFERGFRPPDYNLRALLDAENDESPGVPETGCDAALMGLVERIEREDLPNSIEATEITDLLRFFEEVFRGGALERLKTEATNSTQSVRALSWRFRERMVSSVSANKIHRGANSNEVDGVLNDLMQQEWVIYIRNCLNRADSMVHYLAHYSYRIVTSNGRLLSMEGDQVPFRYQEYRNNSRIKIQWLDGQELVRRFLMHVLPKSLMRIRHFGYLGNKNPTTKTGGYPALPVAATPDQKPNRRARCPNDAGHAHAVMMAWLACSVRPYSSEQQLCQMVGFVALIR